MFMFKRNLAMALATLRARRGRSLLTILGVVIAVAAVTMVISIGRGIQSSIATQASKYSGNVVTVRPAQIGEQTGLAGLSSSTARAAITSKDVENIEKIPSVKSAVPLTVIGSEARGDKSFDGVVFAVSTDLPEVLNQQLAYGAYFTSKEENNNLAVLGSNAADKLFDQKVPLGRGFTIRGQQYIVSGVLENFASTPFASNSNFNSAIFVSAASVKEEIIKDAPIYELLARVNDEQNMDKADAVITKALAKEHGSRDDFKVLSPDELGGEDTALFGLLTKFIVAAALITLLVSGVGIMNVMLVSVTERVHEIGVRKAVGATNKQILAQFITEAVTLSISGSLLGVIVAFSGIWLIDVFSNLSPVYDWKAALLACAAACGFGVLFGSLPAIKAARKDPITALRSE